MPPPTLEAAPDEVQAANEVLRTIFLAVFDAGLTQAEFAERVGVSVRTIENWRAPSALISDTKGPGLLLISRALSALGLELDVRSKNERKRLPLSARNALAETEQDRIRRGESGQERQARHEQFAATRRRMGLISDE